MSEAKSASKRLPPPATLALAMLELFELLVANARDTGNNVAELEAWADEHKPRLERIVRFGPSKQPTQ